MTSPMKNHVLALAAAFMVVCIIGVVSSSSHALDCNGAPPSWADTSAYENWCTRCGGSVSGSGPRIQCKPGPNWGRTGSSSSSGGSGAAGVLYQPFYNLGYGIGQSIGSALFGDAAEDARRAAEQARAAQDAEAEAAARRAEDTRKRQETYNRLSSQLQLSGGFDGGNGSGLDLMLGDGSDGLRPQGTSFFGLGGGQGGSTTGAKSDTKVAGLRPRQGYSAESAAPPTAGNALPLILGDPDEMTTRKGDSNANGDANVVDLRDKAAPHRVDPVVVKGGTKPSFVQMDGERVVSGLNAQAERLGWSGKKVERLNDALYYLGFKNSPTVNDTQAASIWADIQARGQNSILAQGASGGQGPLYPGAGTQTAGHDCAIFALANAAQLPYGVVAARAAELIREAGWRSDAERANPQKTIEDIGLNGGEVIMLAEVFGRAEVVSPANFAGMLKDGKPVLVNLAPGHEVVLTKAFQHRGETWYEVMNSYTGPQQRQYMSDKELNTLLLENGISFSPEPGTTLELLR